jgi:hypothetical protein
VSDLLTPLVAIAGGLIVVVCLVVGVAVLTEWVSERRDE